MKSKISKANIWVSVGNRPKPQNIISVLYQSFSALDFRDMHVRLDECIR